MKTILLGALLMPAVLVFASPLDSGKLEKLEDSNSINEDYEDFYVRDLDQQAQEIIYQQMGEEVVSFRLYLENDEGKGVGINAEGELLGELALSAKSSVRSDIGCGPCGSANNPKRADYYHGNTVIVCSYRCPER